jgi:chromosome segregation ATPase
MSETTMVISVKEFDDLTQAKKVREDLENITREHRRLKDENERNVEDAQKKVKEAETKYDALLEKINHLDNEFKKEYAGRIEAFEIREAKLSADQEAFELKAQELDKREVNFNKSIDVIATQQKEMVEKNEAILANNRLILSDISNTQQSINLVKQTNDVIKKALEEKQSTVEELSKTVSIDIAKLENIKNDIAAKESEVARMLVEIQSTKNEIESIRFINSNILASIEEKNIENLKTLQDINNKLSILDARKLEIKQMLDNQVSELKIVQDVSERNRAEMIALRALQVDLNIKDREIKERLNNLKLLESQAKL